MDISCAWGWLKDLMSSGISSFNDRELLERWKDLGLGRDFLVVIALIAGLGSCLSG